MAIEGRANAPAAWWGLTKLYLLQGKFAEAEKWARKIVDADPDNGQARLLLKAAKQKHLSNELRLLMAGATGGSSASASGMGGQAARGAPANKDGREPARRKLEAAERLVKAVVARFKAGVIGYDEYCKAVLARDLAEADLKGDPVAAARAKVDYWEAYLLVYLEPRAKAGFKTTQLDVEKAQLALSEAKAELAKLEAAGKGG